MPLKLNVGLSKKMGLPRYGSLGAACQVEIELESSLFCHDLDRFQEHVRRAYLACAQAVNDELARQAAEGACLERESVRSTAECANGHANGPNGAKIADRPATPRQLAYAGRLAAQIGGLAAHELDTLADRLFSKPLADLTSAEASYLIETLKAIKTGQVDLQATLNGAAA